MRRPTMTYFKSLLFNFLTVFFVNHVIPGIEIAYYTKLPHIKGDFIFSFALGFLNSLVFPVMRRCNLKPSNFKVGLVTFLISFLGYSVVNLLPLGIKVTTAGAYVWSSLIVWFCGYMTNHFELRQYLRDLEEQGRKKEEDKKLK